MTDNMYKGNYQLTIILTLANIAIVGLGYWDRGELPQVWWPYLLILALILFSYFLDSNTWMKIREGKLISSGQFEFRAPQSVSIHQIKEVRRVRFSWLFSNGGAYISFYGDEGLLMKVRESNYSQETIKLFMTDLKEKLQFTKLDPQYEELVSKPIEELPDFKRSTATHTNFEN